MPSLSFKPEFEPHILNGDKICTIRAPRKRPIKAGELLHFFVGMRTKACRKFADAKCESVLPVVISHEGAVAIGSRLLTSEQMEVFAKTDGFVGPADFLDFFEKQYGLPFRGVCIKWGKLE